MAGDQASRPDHRAKTSGPARWPRPLPDAPVPASGPAAAACCPPPGAEAEPPPTQPGQLRCVRAALLSGPRASQRGRTGYRQRGQPSSADRRRAPPAGHRRSPAVRLRHREGQGPSSRLRCASGGRRHSGSGESRDWAGKRGSRRRGPSPAGSGELAGQPPCRRLPTASRQGKSAAAPPALLAPANPEDPGAASTSARARHASLGAQPGPGSGQAHRTAPPSESPVRPCRRRDQPRTSRPGTGGGVPPSPSPPGPALPIPASPSTRTTVPTPDQARSSCSLNAAS